MELGDNLSGLQNIEVLVAKNEQELHGLLKQLTLPTKIISIYGLNNRHYAWILTQNKIVKKKKKEIKNGDS